LQSHQFCDSICFVLLGLTSLDPPPENGIAINFGTGLDLETFNRQNLSNLHQYNCSEQTAASNQDILSWILKTVVIKKQTKKHNLQRNGEGRG
jgi:hypothetical protein